MSRGWRALRAAGPRASEAGALMQRFAERTGLRSDRPPRRYLWTDAFAVCNFLALWQATGDAAFRTLALELVDQVHAVLGRHRDDDARSGWISGLGEREGSLHPTRGGLRIGKPLPERPRGAPLEERLEWDRDGQYFHYLTRWMHALDQLARCSGEARFNAWARELAEVAHRGFTAGGRRPMAWKMSIDLSRPLVASTGQHDPLDGLVTCLQLRATAARLTGAPREPDLDAAVADFARRIDAGSLATADPLGLGGLLVDAARVAQLRDEGALDAPDLLELLLAAAAAGLARFERGGDLDRPAERRLAFRELGLAIGIAALRPLADCLGAHAGVEALQRFAPLGARIVDFWREPARQRSAVWSEHADIDEVMLASALVPEGVLVLGLGGR